MTKSIHHRVAMLCVAAALCLLPGCMVGPPYQRPSAPTPPAYKELSGWKVAQPKDDSIRGDWWQIYNDPQLDKLEKQVDVSNQSLASATASFFAARALVLEARSQLYPTVTVNPSITVARYPSGAPSSAGSGGTYTDYSLPFDATWTPDLWGSVRSSIHAAAYGAQASAAEIENTRLTIQTEVAEDYFELRGQDALKKILDDTVAADQKILDVTQKGLVDTGIDSQDAVLLAQNQLETAKAEDVALGIARAQYEHALAMLTGQPASSFSMKYQPLKSTPPPIPVGVPSQLLERRPDIAASERLVAAANAQIGIAQAAYYPTVTLSASAGFENTSIAKWITWPSRFFSVGPSASETLYDAGLRQATVTQYKAQYDQTVANYRQTVLTAFQQVEDNLAAMRILSTEIQHQHAAVVSAKKNYMYEMARYKLGLDPYLDVLVARTTLLSSQQTEATLQIQQMATSGALIEALGGGWNASQLPSPGQVGD